MSNRISFGKAMLQVTMQWAFSMLHTWRIKALPAQEGQHTHCQLVHTMCVTTASTSAWIYWRKRGYFIAHACIPWYKIQSCSFMIHNLFQLKHLGFLVWFIKLCRAFFVVSDQQHFDLCDCVPLWRLDGHRRRSLNLQSGCRWLNTLSSSFKEACPCTRRLEKGAYWVHTNTFHFSHTHINTHSSPKFTVRPKLWHCFASKQLHVFMSCSFFEAVRSGWPEPDVHAVSNSQLLHSAA